MFALTFTRRLLVLALLCAVSLSCFSSLSGGNGSPASFTGFAAASDTGGGSSISGGDSKEFRSGSQKFTFQAEVNRLMDIIINSLYSNKDIFLRELISNASDALDKIRFLALTDASALGDGDDAELEIRISLDKEKNMISLRDRGVGMTKEHLVQHLGTIAKSGTSAFIEQMQKGGDVNLIGQFGVGFYSVYLVADFVEVISKHNDDKQHIWESKADGSFAVSEDTENEPLGRGTQINIYLKDDAAEYADQDKLKELVTKYSEFINFPIFLNTTSEVSEEVEIEDGEEEEDAEGDSEDDSEDDAEDSEEESEEEESEEEESEEEDSEEEDKPKTKTVTKTVAEWKLLNDNKAIWLKTPSEVTEEEYMKFYKAVSKTEEEPLTYSHFKAEGDVEFKAILYIPPTAPYDLFDNYYAKAAALKLYVRRVFISDEFDDLVPKYLSFLKGIVDSDTLPLNVSREMLQQHSSLKTIKKKLVRKALDMIRKIAEEKPEDDEEEKKEGEADEAEEKKSEDKETKYEKFWKAFGKAIKLGIIEDASNRTRLAKLLRFYTSQSEDKLTSLEEYVSRMKEGQTHIYYLAGASMDDVKGSPFLEKLLKEGFEVIYFTDPIDEYTMQNLTEFDDKRFANASKEDLSMGEKGKKQQEREKAIKDEFKPLTKWWKSALGANNAGNIDSVKVSTRLSTSPCIVVTSKYGWSANMERIMKAQALGDDRSSYMKGKRTLEINPRHPLIKALKDKVAENEEDDTTKALATLMYETALVESGFQSDEPKAFASRMYNLMSDTLGADPNAEVEEEEEIVEDEEPEEAKEDASEEASDAEADEFAAQDDAPKDEL
ncbi:heat shock protein 90-6 [Pycnococcus provasolii]